MSAQHNLSPSEHANWAQKLYTADKEHKKIGFLSATLANLEDAYSIQEKRTSLALSEGQRLVGYKIGLTSREAQKMFNIQEPDFGSLFKSMECSEELSLKKLIQPKIEGELAFVLEKDLVNNSLEEIEKSIAYVQASLEIVDSRFEGWKIKAVDTIADNGSSAYFVLGKNKVSIKNLDLRRIGMAFSKNKEVMFTGAGASVMGHPLKALQFLAKEMASRGKSLKAGQVILSGSLTAMLPMTPSDIFQAEFSDLGTVSLKVSL